MPGDTLQAIEYGVDQPDSKMTGTTLGAGVTDVQMARVRNLNIGLGKGLPKAFEQCIVGGFHGVFFRHDGQPKQPQL